MNRETRWNAFNHWVNQTHCQYTEDQLAMMRGAFEAGIEALTDYFADAFERCRKEVDSGIIKNAPSVKKGKTK